MKNKKTITIVAITLLFVAMYSFFSNKKEEITITPQGIMCSTGELEGRKCANLYATYIDVTPGTVIGDSLSFDASKVLTRLWTKKIEISPSRVVKETGETLLEEYNNKQTKVSFREYSNHITDVVNELQKDIDWDILKEEMNLSEEKASLAKSITETFDGKDMVAYIMTELMPSADGVFNRNMLDFMLTNGGIEYVGSIPAMGDEKTSFGPYQFTEYALFHTPKEKRGASVINTAVKHDVNKIPGSVSKLRGDAHHKAAYLFAVYNICMLVKGLDKKQMVTLKSVWKANKDDLFIYCATAHHLPAVARRAAKNWLDNKAAKPFENSCKPSILSYAKKTRANLKAL